MNPESTPLLNKPGRPRRVWWRRVDVVLVLCCLMGLGVFELYSLIVPEVYDAHPRDGSYVNPYGEGGAIQQVFVVPGGGEGRYGVSWVTFLARDTALGSSIVEVEGKVFTSKPSVFVDTLECPGVARVIHAVEIDLEGHGEIPYTIRYRGESWSGFLRTILDVGEPGLRAVLFGDLAGMTYNHHNGTSIPLLVRDSEQNLTDIIVHIGDIAYNLDDDCGKVGDGFMNDIMPAASRTPYVFGPGNHEAEKWELASYNHYLHRYRVEKLMGVASRSFTNRWFSFEAGQVHFVVLDADAWVNRISFSRARVQRDWLIGDLKRVNRSVTPWIVVCTHRALYCTKNSDPECTSEAASLRQGGQWYLAPDGIEPVLLQYGVDVVLSGHTHHYERTYPLIDGKVSPRGIVHIQSGIGGGAGQDYFTTPQQPWEAFRDTQYRRGVNQATFHNATHVTFTEVDVNGDMIDTVTIVQYDHEGPRVA